LHDLNLPDFEVTLDTENLLIEVDAIIAQAGEDETLQSYSSISMEKPMMTNLGIFLVKF
jgi:hypothetical protein